MKGRIYGVFLIKTALELYFNKNIKYGDIDPPTKLNGLSNVWCTCFIVFSTLLLLNIVETVKKTTNKTS